MLMDKANQVEQDAAKITTKVVKEERTKQVAAVKEMANTVIDSANRVEIVFSNMGKSVVVHTRNAFDSAAKNAKVAAEDIKSSFKSVEDSVNRASSAFGKASSKIISKGTGRGMTHTPYNISGLSEGQMKTVLTDLRNQLKEAQSDLADAMKPQPYGVHKIWQGAVKHRIESLKFQIQGVWDAVNKATNEQLGKIAKATPQVSQSTSTSTEIIRKPFTLEDQVTALRNQYYVKQRYPSSGFFNTEDSVTSLRNKFYTGQSNLVNRVLGTEQKNSLENLKTSSEGFSNATGIFAESVGNHESAAERFGAGVGIFDQIVEREISARNTFMRRLQESISTFEQSVNKVSFADLRDA